MENNSTYTGFEIAITGMACRFPGAMNWKAYWENLANGVESVHFFSAEELSALGIEPDVAADSNYVAAKVSLEGKQYFDSFFFNYRPDDAALLNPEHRIFHECAWEALEDAGYDPARANGPIGVYAGAGGDLSWQLYSMLKNSDRIDGFTLGQLNNKDYLASLLSYKLQLNGPAFSVNTACSTSLVAVHLACKSLLLGDARVILAGGVTIKTQPPKGYMYQQGMILSADGHCRAFDADATGTIGSEGAGVVVLKRLKDALADGDQIHAIIKGSAINNDGNRKVGYTAPSVEGQVECIRMAYKFAKVDPATVGYVESHGTGTKLGDPIEIEALNTVFGNTGSKNCMLGAVKTNIGHLDTAAGVAGLIKAVLCLKNRQVPPTLHFRSPNPEINFDEGPFYVNTSLTDWNNTNAIPLRAGVSSFGIGGTNAHVVLEQALLSESLPSERHYKILSLSARTENALNRYAAKLKDYVLENSSVDLDDMSYTQHIGRKHFEYRQSFAYKDRSELLQKLDEWKGAAGMTKNNQAVLFLFPGQGAQYVNMGKELYETEAVFKTWMDQGFTLLQEITGVDHKSIIYNHDSEQGLINRTKFTQPLLFLFEYALARLVMSYGVTPQCMLAHSIGEYAAACISGVFTFEDAIRLVARRAELMDSLPQGTMISVPLSAKDAEPYVSDHVAIAAVNGPQQVVLSGNTTDIQLVIDRLLAADIVCIKLHTSHAFHSSMQEPVMDAFRKELEKISFGRMNLPFVSNLTGILARETQVCQPEYWVQHLRRTVRFSEGVAAVLSQEKDWICLEVGPGRSLTSLVKQQATAKVPALITLLRHPKEDKSDSLLLSDAISRLWSHGIPVDWKAWYQSEKRRRISLPTYAFEHIEYPVEIDLFQEDLPLNINALQPTKGQILKDWIYYPIWKTAVLPVVSKTASTGTYLFFSAQGAFSAALSAQLLQDGNKVVHVFTGDQFKKESPYSYDVDPVNAGGFSRLAAELTNDGIDITHVIYCWNLEATAQPELHRDNRNLHLVYFSLVNIVKSLLNAGTLSKRKIIVLTNKLYDIPGTESLSDSSSLTGGLMNALPQEYSVSCLGIDIDMNEPHDTLVKKIALEINAGQKERIVGIRKGRRWLPDYEQNQYPLQTDKQVFREKGVYIITGGAGNLGRVLADHLNEKYNATVILLGRSDVPVYHKIYYRVDITELDLFRQVVDEIEAVHGKISGVIHAAGVTDHKKYELVEDITTENAFAVMAPKITGLKNIYTIFKDRAPDFVLATSSIASVLGGITYSSYAAANLYMDSFIMAVSKVLPGWKSIQLPGMLFKESEINNEKNTARTALKPAEICELVEWTINQEETPVITATVKGLHSLINKIYYEEKQMYLDNQPASAIVKMGRPDLKSSFIAPETETEIAIVEMMETFFGINDIGIADNFFELGGDSLKATIFIRKIEQTFNVRLSMADFFLAENIRKICQETDEKIRLNKAAESKFVSAASIPVSNIMDGYPLSSSQMRLWVLSQFPEAAIAYNLPDGFIFEGALDRDALQQALLMLIERHEILRTVFREDGKGEVRQFVLPAAESGITIKYHDLRHLTDQDEAAESMIQEEAVQPFDLSIGALLRVNLYRLTTEKWILTYTIHHIVCDGWSMSIIIRELFLFYDVCLKQLENPLQPLKIQYKDYAVWQQEELRNDQTGSDRQYWLKQFEGDLPVLDLPGAKKRPAVKTYNGASVNRLFDPVLSAGIKAMSQENGCTTFMTMVSAVAALLHRYTGQDDIVIGTTIAGRGHADLENQVGFYVNTLALRTRPRSDENFVSLSQRVRQVTLDAYEHQFYPFNDLVNELKVKRDTSRHPLFDVEVMWQFTETGSSAGDGMESLTVREYKSMEKYHGVFDLIFKFVEAGEQIYCNIIFNTDIYDEKHAIRVGDHLEKLLRAVVNDAVKPVGQLSYLTEKEKELLLHTFNDTKEDYKYNDHKTIVALFEEKAAIYPTSIAVVAEDGELTYAALDHSAAKLASWLKNKAGIRTNDLVGIVLDRSAAAIIAILGVLKAGAAYIPVDPSYPEARKKFILEDAGVGVLITDEKNSRQTGHYNGQLIMLDEVLAEYSDDTFTLVPVDPRDLAYVIYTSGSTGSPKGVMIGHAAIFNTILGQKELFDVQQHQKGLQFASLSFDASVWEMFLILTAGATLYIPDEQTRKSPALLAEYISEHNIDIATLPPVYLSTMEVDAIKGLKTLITAGEAAIADKAQAFSTHGRYFNAYGPTETAICATAYYLSPESFLPGKDIPIGKPLPGVQVYILDANLELLPPGAVGEICVGGKGLARGYLNNEILTAEKFVPDPFHIGERLYRTGDLGKLIADGNIQFCGRKDTQVKVRGHRIEPGEIENTLQTHPDIDGAVVIPDTTKGEYMHLVAFVTGKETLHTDEISAWLKRLLPVYMLPDLFIRLNEFPLTTHGKIDRKKLAEQIIYDDAPETHYQAPAGEIEERMVEIWQSFLGGKKIGVTDNFFEKGGNSISIIKLSREISSLLGKEVSIATLFQYPNIKDLMDFISSETVISNDDVIDNTQLIEDLNKFNLQSHVND